MTQINKYQNIARPSIELIATLSVSIINQMFSAHWENTEIENGKYSRKVLQQFQLQFNYQSNRLQTRINVEKLFRLLESFISIGDVTRSALSPWAWNQMLTLINSPQPFRSLMFLRLLIWFNGKRLKFVFFRIASNCELLIKMGIAVPTKATLFRLNRWIFHSALSAGNTLSVKTFLTCLMDPKFIV